MHVHNLDGVLLFIQLWLCHEGWWWWWQFSWSAQTNGRQKPCGGRAISLLRKKKCQPDDEDGVSHSGVASDVTEHQTLTHFAPRQIWKKAPWQMMENVVTSAQFLQDFHLLEDALHNLHLQCSKVVYWVIPRPHVTSFTEHPPSMYFLWKAMNPSPRGLTGWRGMIKLCKGQSPNKLTLTWRRWKMVVW